MEFVAAARRGGSAQNLRNPQEEGMLSNPGRDIASMTLEELQAVVRSLGEKPYRAAQLFSWIHEKNVSSYAEMTNLPKKFRESLAQQYSYAFPEIRTRQESKDGTVKFLFAYADGALVESVLMPYAYGHTLCISSQVGCRMGCAFCASGLNGLMRNLTTGEMLGEVYAAGKSEGVRISNIVLMGTGEPLDNYDNVVRFLQLIAAEEGKNLSGRNVAVSTCGLVPKIRALAGEHFTCALALSLHAPTDALRQTIMPVAKRYSLKETIGAMRYYAEETGRRVTFEYALIAGINDSDDCADALGMLVKDLHPLINLIPMNPVAESGFSGPGADGVARFKKRLEKYRINVTIRREMGRDIDGACGQLRRRYLK